MLYNIIEKLIKQTIQIIKIIAIINNTLITSGDIAKFQECLTKWCNCKGVLFDIGMDSVIKEKGAIRTIATEIICAKKSLYF